MTTLTPELLQALRELDACTLANAIETFHQRLRSEGFTDSTIRCLLASALCQSPGFSLEKLRAAIAKGG